MIARRVSQHYAKELGVFLKPGADASMKEIFDKFNNKADKSKWAFYAIYVYSVVLACEILYRWFLV